MIRHSQNTVFFCKCVSIQISTIFSNFNQTFLGPNNFPLLWKGNFSSNSLWSKASSDGFSSILELGISPIAKPAKSHLPLRYVPPISAVSPPINLQFAILQPFIIPPSINDLRSRLKSRGSETDEAIEKSLRRFDKEMKYKDQFDTLLINDNIKVAIKDFITKVNLITKGVY